MRGPPLDVYKTKAQITMVQSILDSYTFTLENMNIETNKRNGSLE